MSFSRWYPVSSFYYDPAINPTKPIANLQAQDESKYRKIPKGRYDTTYRREYLNHQGLKTEDYKNQNSQSLSDSSSLNPFQILPPITPKAANENGQNEMLNSQQQNMMSSDSYGEQNQPEVYEYHDPNDQHYLPKEPVFLEPHEEEALVIDMSKELTGFSTSQLKNFYSDMTKYDPQLTGFAPHNYITAIAAKNDMRISESLMRFVMSRFVSPSQQRGKVNYEELVKFIAKCLGESSSSSSSSRITQPSQPKQYRPVENTSLGLNSRIDQTNKYDPDEQAILRLMVENMKDWDQVNFIDCDNLREKLSYADPHRRYTLTQPEIEDVLYKNRIPIQRSLIYQILEKYCKVSTGQYRWPAFVDFLERTYNLKLKNKTKANSYILREDEKDRGEIKDSQLTYRSAHLEALRSIDNEAERIEEINKQMYSSRAEDPAGRFADVGMGPPESWFTRFMRLANAMYTHRINAGIDFVLPKDEARQLVNAYNAVYQLHIPETAIEDALVRCSLKGNVIIDDLLKVLSRVH